MAWADRPAATLVVHMEAAGDVTIRVTSRLGQPAGAVLDRVVHCRGGITSKNELFGEFRCAHALRREGLLLQGVVDLGPIVETLEPTDEIEVWLEYPRMGLKAPDAGLAGLRDLGSRRGVVRTGQFPAGRAPGPFRIEFGYRTDQLPGIYFPLAAMALAMTLITAVLSKAGYSDLSRSVFLLGTIFWLSAATRLQAADPLRILLSGTPLGNIAATWVEYCPPLLLVAAGTAMGSWKREMFGEVFWGFGMLLFPLATVLGAIPSMAEGDWMIAVPWLMAAPLSVFVCRWRIRANSGGSVRELNVGELKDRITALAARTGRHDVKVYVSSSTRSQVLNAFAMLRNGILLTAPLVGSLSRREVDAVAAHELSHFGHVRRNHVISSQWAALAVAVVLFQTPLTELLFQGAGGLSIALVMPLIVFFTALHGARKREFGADAGSVALTGDARAMISALARIARKNEKPLDRNAVAEWFSTHPSTRKRIGALAAIGRLEPGEVETLMSSDDPGAGYTLPPDDGGMIFTLAWQNANASRYAWATLLGSSGAGLLVAGLVDRFGGSGLPQLVGGIALGCVFTRVLAATVMSVNYVGLRRRLARKLGGGGQLVGLAMEGEPRVYDGFRFSDTGFVSFEEGRFCYRSERTSIFLNAGDVVEVGMVAAAPSSWRRLQPVVRFRTGESPEVKAIILHTLDWGATPGHLYRSIVQWRATATAGGNTSISGFTTVAGQAFHIPTLGQVARGFRVPGVVTLVGASLAGWFWQTGWLAWYALAVTACAYTFMFLPAMLYRPSSLPPALPPPLPTTLTPPVEAD
jgi:Zn-dependent protease with chaperone function